MIRLNDYSTLPPDGTDKEQAEKDTKTVLEELKELQNILYAQQRFSLLIVMQGMDASGKDGAIKNVFSGVNPMGCDVVGFKKPTEEEMHHDFLWRVHRHAPAKGMIQIFNRSHYEDVIIQRVHHWVNEETIKGRYEHINHFEQLLTANDTTVLKFYLHVSKKEQMDRLKERLSDRKKMWKYNPDDLKESERWPEYMDAYERAFNHCSREIPWTIVPSDKNWYKEYVISKTIVEALRKLPLEYPSLGNQAS